MNNILWAMVLTTGFPFGVGLLIGGPLRSNHMTTHIVLILIMCLLAAIGVYIIEQLGRAEGKGETVT